MAVMGTKGGLARTVAVTRPCMALDPRRWDTGNPGNAGAIALCGTCPFRIRCLRENPDPVGVIVAGVPYDEKGLPLHCCRRCGHPLARWPGRKTPTCTQCPPPVPPVAVHHDRIAQMRAAGASFAEIGEAIGRHADAVRGYWERYEARQRRESIKIKEES